jgi:hypothetical protein
MPGIIDILPVPIAVSSFFQALKDNRMYKLQYFENNEWKTWIPTPAPWEKDSFGEELPALVALEGILILLPQFPIRVIPLT